MAKELVLVHAPYYSNLSNITVTLNVYEYGLYKQSGELQNVLRKKGLDVKKEIFWEQDRASGDITYFQ